MIQIRPERFPFGIVKKLQARSASPFKVLKRIGSNAYVIGIPHDYGISSSFNIEALVAYNSPIAIPYTPFDEPLLDPIDAHIPTPLPLNLPYAQKNLLMLFQMSILFLPGTKEFTISQFGGEGHQILIAHGLLEMSQ